MLHKDNNISRLQRVKCIFTFKCFSTIPLLQLQDLPLTITATHDKQYCESFIFLHSYKILGRHFIHRNMYTHDFIISVHLTLITKITHGHQSIFIVVIYCLF
jgi:hypothetical protein